MAFTDRRGGFSSPPFDSFNLGKHVGDEPAAVEANRELLASALGLAGARMRYVSQVHGNHVHEVLEPGAGSPGVSGTDTGPVEADAQFTTALDLGLVILVADCTPILLADPDAGVVAAVHAGRKGMAAGIVRETVDRMHARGAQRIRAAIGPSVCPRCYEVPADMRAEVAEREPVSASVSRTGTPALDVAAGVAAGLHRAGVEIVHWSRACTYEHPDLFSHRAGAPTGRFAGVVWLRRDPE